MSHSHEPSDSITAFCQGDQQVAHHLRESLRSIADTSSSATLRAKINDVLTERLSFRALTRDPEMIEVMNSGMDLFAQSWSQASPAARLDQLRAAQDALNAEREREGLPAEDLLSGLGSHSHLLEG